MGVEPVADEPAAVADLPGERALVVADYHAGLEVGLRRDGVELRSRAGERRTHLLSLLDATDANRLVVLGDLGNEIGDPGREERAELERLLSVVTEHVPVTLVKGNHDGDLESLVAETDVAADVTVTPGTGTRIGDVGFAHGHTWPAPEVLTGELVCTAHEHPMVRLEDEVGGSRAERAWLRGRLEPAPFVDHHGDALDADAVTGELIVFPAFNDLLGGTWANVEGQEFLAPYLPDGLRDGQAYLLDGTRLGDYRQV